MLCETEAGRRRRKITWNREGWRNGNILFSVFSSLWPPHAQLYREIRTFSSSEERGNSFFFLDRFTLAHFYFCWQLLYCHCKGGGNWRVKNQYNKHWFVCVCACARVWIWAKLNRGKEPGCSNSHSAGCNELRVVSFLVSWWHIHCQ